MHRAQEISLPGEPGVDDAVDGEKSLGLRPRRDARIWGSRWRVGWCETSIGDTWHLDELFVTNRS